MESQRLQADQQGSANPTRGNTRLEEGPASNLAWQPASLAGPSSLATQALFIKTRAQWYQSHRLSVTIREICSQIFCRSTKYKNETIFNRVLKELG